MIAETIFWLSVSAGFYHHIAYPLLLRLFTREKLAQQTPAIEPGIEPSIAVIVPAHNEEAVLGRKIENLASLVYPRDRLSIIIACDGCTDGTVEMARAAIARVSAKPSGVPPLIDLVVYSENIGKTAVLNDQIAAADADLVALTDASALLPAHALTSAAGHFGDARAGFVSGTYRLPAESAGGERLYWSYQCEIKAREAQLCCPFGAHGAFYVFRRDAWRPLPPDTINDDVMLPMAIVARGYRGIYDRSIAVDELELTTPLQDFRRRKRIGAGNLQQAIRLFPLASPARPGLMFVFLSGKTLRGLLPFLGAAGSLSALWLATRGSSTFFGITLMLLAGLIVCALPYGGLPRILQPVSTFGRGYAAAFLGAAGYLLGLYRTPWRRVSLKETADERVYIPAPVAIGKRILDLVCGLSALALLAILYVPLAIAIKLSSKGPVFYRQMRVGRITPEVTELFWLIKFRTMRADAETVTGPVWATDNDPRITRLGRFMRKSRLDELPQCINVLRGEMSVVGPRPERPGFFRRLESEIPFYIERTYGLRPGITGLAQINQAYDQDIEDVRNKVLYDHAYALRLSRWADWLKADLGIIVKTALVMVTGRGAK